jgi:hypothetical protein
MLMSKPITIFTGANGLVTKVDPARLKFDPKTGVQDLAVAVNVDIDPTGRIGRRKGFAATARTENIHSLWCEGGACLFVTGTSLCELFSDYRHAVIVTVTQGAAVSYFQLKNRSYWMNGFEKGFIENQVNNSWGKGTYVGPATTRQFSDPPLGHMIAYGFGYVFIAQGPTIWYSEPFNVNAFDLSRNYLPFEDRVAMLRPLPAGGVWVSTGKETHFLPGMNPRETGPMKIADYPAIEGTDALIDLSKVGSGEMSGIGVIWTSTNGICVGTSEGQMLNLTQRRIDYPRSIFGAGICFDDRYVTTLEP